MSSIDFYSEDRINILDQQIAANERAKKNLEKETLRLKEEREKVVASLKDKNFIEDLMFDLLEEVLRREDKYSSYEHTVRGRDKGFSDKRNKIFALNREGISLNEDMTKASIAFVSTIAGSFKEFKITIKED